MGSISKWDAISLEEFRNIRDELIDTYHREDTRYGKWELTLLPNGRIDVNAVSQSIATFCGLEAIAIIVNRKVRQ